MEPTIEQFIKTFDSCEIMPKNKKEFMARLYYWWKMGKQNRESEIQRNLENKIKEILKV